MLATITVVAARLDAVGGQDKSFGRGGSSTRLQGALECQHVLPSFAFCPRQPDSKGVLGEQRRDGDIDGSSN